MTEIKCPNCGKVFTIDESSYAAIEKQVRDKTFDRELERRSEEAVKLAEAKKDSVIAGLQADLQQMRAQRELAVRDAVEQLKRETAAKEQELQALRMKVKSDAELFETQKRLAVQDAVRAQEELQHEKEKQILELQAQIGSIETAHSLKEKQMTEDRDRLLKIKDDEIAYYKDLKARMSTKMVGEERDGRDGDEAKE